MVGFLRENPNLKWIITGTSVCGIFVLDHDDGILMVINPYLVY